MTNSLSRWVNILRWPVRFLVRSKLVPKDPCAELNIDRHKPIVYVLKTESLTDLVALERICKSLKLPLPTQPLQLGERKIPRYFCVQGRVPVFGKNNDANKFINRFSELINFLRQPEQQDVQIVPVALFWGRKPGREDDTVKAAVIADEQASWLRKIMMVLFLGRDNFVRFSQPISMVELIASRSSDERIAHKLSRLARFHFHRQAQTMLGPKLLYRNSLDQRLMKSPALQVAMQEYAQQKNLSDDQVKAEVSKLVDEIAANYSERLLRIGDRVLTWLWNKLYKGINISNAERVRQLAQDGEEIIFVPCHRSHMDYLLLSYVIYRQGMVPPHIAAGINLSFWPAGPIFRRGGAFFMRRTFKGNKLYAAVFREYLHQLFNNGYSVKYFTEGGRSRTGRLLSPKTGMIAMTVQGALRGIERPITLVPVYLGYDHVMEVGTYHSELKGKSKEKESVGQVVKTLRKLKNFGRGYVNFGQPISLNKHLDNEVPQWHESINPMEQQKPSWLTPTVNSLANKVMVNINNAAAVTAITLSALVVLGVERRVIAKSTLEAQLDLYLKLLRQARYSADITIPELSGKELLAHAIELKKFTVSEDDLGQVISLDISSAVTMTYYRNNILHLFALPSLIAASFVYHGVKTREQLDNVIEQLYPLLKNELFIGLSQQELATYVDDILLSLTALELISDSDGQYTIMTAHKPQLMILAQHIQETLERYAIVLKIMQKKPHIERSALNNDSHALAKRLSNIHGINAPEFFDKQVLSSFISELKEQGYIDHDDSHLPKVDQLVETVSGLLLPNVLATIKVSLN
ncbi:glycerol-3-phosphate 1-O-acyltransferase PlsB [Psychrobium sp. 1_MG-2023]|uniref:glycerol-3-phosphate 1-O-acyltransferase PlsB n=1 Tax=Psychrobium sp. 1_MG-2023 TaxID=3062624 RepID=UPI000C322F7B|nr:glycerol-3-phosphate 1-O-acyltransferase PlsB [Psychrobium sp. 1_MG-2023]MDP2559560.1 glycerol-3-phosphate 1-O-acyltransferase PlsB [Psychrobium sp. 1_MG-2023]PKF59399.1 glycerol-3-phosphate 1-O-acyltransferase [Alteromonadales bacterium alter-6D02]